MPDIKTAHFYWGESKKMPFLNFLSVLTFRNLHPAWEVILYTSEDSINHPTWLSGEQRHNYTGKDYLEACKGLCDRAISIDYEELGFSNEIHDVHKADILRQYLLYKDGGLWSDMDVLWLKPIEEVNIDGADITLVLSGRHHSSGIMYSSGNKNSFYESVLKHVRSSFDTSGYQIAGPSALNFLYPTIDSIESSHPELTFKNLPYSTFYPYDSVNCPDFFKIGAVDLVGDGTVAVHWFNGHLSTATTACHVSPDSIEKYKGSPFFSCVNELIDYSGGFA